MTMTSVLLLCVATLVPCILAKSTVNWNQTLYAHREAEVDLAKAESIQIQLVVDTPAERIFETFKKVYKRHYESKYEEATRRGIFGENVKYIKDHNLLYNKGEKSYFLGVNQFTDMTHEEFLKFYTEYIPMSREPSINASIYLTPSNILLPGSVDWRESGYVTPVKNQGKCGSCWAFSTTGSLEGQHFKKTQHLISLSEQQLVDCSLLNSGCKGGLMDTAFRYIKSSGGIESEADYPYVAMKQPSCMFEKSLVRATVRGYTDIQKGSESKLQDAVASTGPVSVAIDASQRSFQSYAGGVYDEPMCTTQINHAVLVVGYGTNPSDYWLVKNSWAAIWGEMGYIRMSRNKNNQCGIASMASYPLV